MRLNAETIQSNYPKFIGFEGMKESLVSYISSYYEMSECEKIELITYDQPHLTEAKATFTNGTVSINQISELQRWAYIDAGSL